jgi:hypothetical protein
VLTGVSPSIDLLSFCVTSTIIVSVVLGPLSIHECRTPDYDELFNQDLFNIFHKSPSQQIGSKYDVVVFVCSYRFTSEVNFGHATRVLEFDNNQSHTL